MEIEDSTKKLLFAKLNETGDNPEDVTCIYIIQWPTPTDLPQLKKQCSAANLPEGKLKTLDASSKKNVYKLVKTDTEIRIDTKPILIPKLQPHREPLD